VSSPLGIMREYVMGFTLILYSTLYYKPLKYEQQQQKNNITVLCESAIWVVAIWGKDQGTTLRPIKNIHKNFT
jgi:hypothetical protein